MIKTVGHNIKFSAQASYIFEIMKQYPDYRIFEISIKSRNRLAYEFAEVKESLPHAYSYLRIGGRMVINKHTVWFLISQGLLEETVAWEKSINPRKCYKLNESRAGMLEKQE